MPGRLSPIYFQLRCAEILVETEEIFDRIVAVVKFDTLMKDVGRQMLHSLSENELARVHSLLLRALLGEWLGQRKLFKSFSGRILYLCLGGKSLRIQSLSMFNGSCQLDEILHGQSFRANHWIDSRFTKEGRQIDLGGAG